MEPHRALKGVGLQPPVGLVVESGLRHGGEVEEHSMGSQGCMLGGGREAGRMGTKDFRS